MMQRSNVLKHYAACGSKCVRAQTVSFRLQSRGTRVTNETTAQESAWGSAMNIPQTASYPHPGASVTGGHIDEQISLYETGDAQCSVNTEFMFTDMQVRDMLSQSTGLQPPWNLDDIGWGNMLSQNY